jgi:divalent metal cation (Fe/Co/Zn/Cd) transporter
MSRDEVPNAVAERSGLVAVALRLLLISVGFGAVTGVISVLIGLGDQSLGVFGVGLGVLADVTGSAVLIWRFRAEQRRGGPSGQMERRAAVVVAVALAVVSIVLTTEAVAALAARSHPGTSAAALVVAGISLAVLAPLAYAKRRLGWRMRSAALRGDGALSAVGAATSLLALAGLALYHALGWWWADRAAALVVAAIAAVEAWRTVRGSRSQGGH